MNILVLLFFLINQSINHLCPPLRLFFEKFLCEISFVVCVALILLLQHPKNLYGIEIDMGLRVKISQQPRNNNQVTLISIYIHI